MGVSFAGLNAPYDIIIGLPTSFCENEIRRPCICCRKVGLPGACAGSNLSTWLGHRHLLVGGPIRGMLRQETADRTLRVLVASSLGGTEWRSGRSLLPGRDLTMPSASENSHPLLYAMKKKEGE